MKRMLALLSPTVLAACIALTTSASATERRPNVLLLYVDDLRPELRAYGAEHISSPHIDALAADGILFDRAYCQVSQCNPSRASLLTGLRPDTTQVHDNEGDFLTFRPDTITLPEHFMRNGYRTLAVGKVFHQGGAQSWHARLPYHDTKQERVVADIERGARLLPADPQAPRGPAWASLPIADELLPDGQIATAAIELIRAHRREPFFIAVGFHKPHLPFVAPQRYFDLYPKPLAGLGAHNPVSPGTPEIALTQWPELRRYAGIPAAPAPVQEEAAVDLIRAYRACVSFVDAQIGRVLAEIDALNLRESTIVVLVGDHGWHLLEQGLWCKSTNFEVALRVPLILRYPSRISAGTQSSALIELVDLFPTLNALAGLPALPELEGDSFVPLFDDGSMAWKKAAFSQHVRPGGVMGRTLRTDRFRYTEWQQSTSLPDGKTSIVASELYDHRTDPNETENLASIPAWNDVRAELSELLQKGWRHARP